MSARRPVVLALLAAFAFAPALATAKSYHAERFDVQVAVERDGSARVTETIVFRFTEGEFTQVYREVPTRYTDGIGGVRAELDGRDVTGDVQVERRATHLRVTWTMPPTSNVARRFVLSYRLLGVTRHDAGQDVFRWTALPRAHEYRIDASTVIVVLPPGVTLTEAPSVSSPGGEGRRRVDVSTAISTDQVVFTAGDIGRNGTYTVTLAARQGQLAAGPPAWQRVVRERTARAPIAAAVAGVASLLGLTLLVIMWRNAPRPDAAVPAHVSRQAEPPDTLAPALAGALRSGGRIDGRLALAALFDLARRGAVRIEEQPRQGRWGSRTFTVIRGEVPQGLRPHEREVLALAFPEGKGAPTKLSDIATKMTTKGQAFRKALTEEIDQARWLSADRLAARRRLWVAAGAVLATAFLTIVIALLTLDYWGAWGVLLPAGLAIVAGLGFVLGSTIPVLSDDGLRQANRWRGFAAEVKTLSRSQSGPAGAHLDHWFAYAVAFGLGAAWAKRLDAAGLADTVGWLRVVAAPNGARSAGFVAMMSGTHGASPGGGGAGGGGGAAGGGSSGAH